MRRRYFLATLGAGTLAGCGVLGGGSDFERAEDPFTDVNSEERGDATVQSGLAILEQGQFAAAGFQGGTRSDTFTLEVTGQVMQGGPVDVYIMTLPQFNEFKRRPNIVPSEIELSNTNAPDLSREMPTGEYFLVFDNTPLGRATPSGEARIEFSITVGAISTETPTTTSG